MKNFILLTLVIFLCTVCDKDMLSDFQSNDVDYRQEMRSFVQKISQYAKSIDEDFIIIPQNGQEIITQNGEADGLLVSDYLAAIDGTGREDLFYGYHTDNELTPENEKNYLIAFCDLCEQNNLEVLTIDYCSSHNKMDSSYVWNQEKGYISFAAPERELNIIPDYPSQPFQVNKSDIISLKDAKNFLYLINPENFSTKQDFINAVTATNYDLLVMDCFVDEQSFSASEVAQLKTKQNHGTRLVVAYLSIGEAEDYRYYWQDSWKISPPDWLEEENPHWEGNYKVKYWDQDWQNIICGSNNSYLGKILEAGFDGVYLDLIDAYEYFE
ncbi:MAG: endo alpha-1,4 polygalactosaminidase [bacterium]